MGVGGCTMVGASIYDGECGTLDLVAAWEGIPVGLRKIVEVCGMITGLGSREIMLGILLQTEGRLVKLLYGFQYCFSTHALQESRHTLTEQSESHVGNLRRCCYLARILLNIAIKAGSQYDFTKCML